MEALLLQQFQQLVAARLGLHVREQERELLKKTLTQRVQALSLPHADDYYRLLNGSDPQSEAEWKHLSILLTNQESYFFRDQGQFALLQRQILPELIERNRKQRTLRLWSAGCSTGQEPYSLAILVDQLLPFRDDWNIFVLGTDLSEAALEKARRGLYSTWSFRTMEQEIQHRYFHRQRNEYELDEKIRKLVTFRHGNLLQDVFPSQSSGIYDVDLILCRNVFIYFKRDAVTAVLHKFNRALRPEGYLLTGHAELHDTPLGDLCPRMFPQTVIYQRRNPDARQETPPLRATQPIPKKKDTLLFPASTVTETSATSNTAKPETANPSALVPKAEPFKPTNRPDSLAVAKVAAKPVGSTDEKIIEEAMVAVRLGHSVAALTKLEPLLQQTKPHLGAQCLAAQALANSGRYDEAIEHCQRAAKIDAFAPLPFHILAHIAEERGQQEEAKDLLKKVIYLAPSMVTPYLELSAIYTHEGDTARAKKMRDTALELLTSLAPADPLPTHPFSVDKPITAGELRKHLQES